MRKLKLFLTLMIVAFLGYGQVWGTEETYTFTSKAWAATNSASQAANWTSGKDGGQLTSDRGVQITSTVGSANATSPASLTNISKIVVTYSTNANNGAGSISLQIGNNTEQSQNVTKTGGTADRTLEYNYATAETGSIKLTVTCTTNSIYVKSVTVTYNNGGQGSGNENATDELTASDLVATNTTYVDFSDVSKSSGARYAGNSAKTSTGGIQLRSKNSNSGIVSTTSGGTVKSVTITVESGSNTIDVYGSNTAYSAASDLYGNNKGTKIGSLTENGTINFTSDYEYVGIRSNNGAIYLTSVEIAWTPSATQKTDVTDEQLAWSASSAIVTKDAGDNVFPSIINTIPVDVTYQSTDETVAQISSTGEITLLKAGSTTIKAIYAGSQTLNAKTISYTLTVKKPAPAPISGGITDILDNAWTGKTSSTYGDVAEKTAANEGHSNAKYIAQCAGENSTIQLRSNNNNSGIVSTISGGILKRIEITWNASTANERTLYIYGSNTVYSSASDLYDEETYGDLLGSLNKGLAETVLDFSEWEGDYKYIGIRSASGAMYLNNVSFTWLPISSAVKITNPQHGTITLLNGEDPVTSNTEVANGTILTVSGVSTNVAYKFGTISVKNHSTQEDVPSTVYNAAAGTITMPDYAIDITATEIPLLKVELAIDEAGMGTATINDGTDPVYVESGETVNLAITSTADHHEFVNWTAGNGITITSATAASTTATITAAGTITANFQEQDCSNLAAPTLKTLTKTYNSATIEWNAVDNASSYLLNVTKHGSSEKIVDGEVINAPTVSKALSNLKAETQYDYSIMAVGDGTYFCSEGNGVLNSNFTTNPLPTAHLTLLDIEGEHDDSGDYTILTSFNLPTTAASCSKSLYGWTATNNYESENDAPEYAAGDPFMFEDENPVTLYAVYADIVEPTPEEYTFEEFELGSTENNLIIDDPDAYEIQLLKSSAQTKPAWNAGTSEARIYAGGALKITASTPIKKIVYTYAINPNKNNVVPTIDGAAGATNAGNWNEETKTWTGSDTEVNFVTSGSAGNVGFTKVSVTIGNNTISNYSTTCVVAPVATPNPTSVAVEAASDNGSISVSYENVKTENISVAICNNNQGAAFTGDWLEASIVGNDKHIEYTVHANESYNDARTAYIQLTAPALSTGVNDAVVYIPVTQAKKQAVFASLEDLVEADVNANTNVTVSFENVVIKEIYMYNSNRRGLVFGIQKDNEDIKIYFNADVPVAWTAGGSVTGTLTNCPWKIWSGAWQLAPTSGWEWSNLTYNNPPEIASIEIRGNATAKTYIDGQVFNPAGLSVIAIYDNSLEEDVTSYATWTYDPAKLSTSDTQVTATAEYSNKSDSKTINELVVSPIPNKTIDEFITAGGTRCYLEGTVSNYTNTTKGYFDLTDNSGTIHIYGCTSPSSFAAGDKIKVIAEDYELYQGTTPEAKNVEFVSKVAKVEITIATEKNLYVNDTWTIEVTTNPAEAVDHISYSLNDGSDACIDETELANGVIKAIAEGDATITVTIPDGDGYLANTVEMNVHVNPAIVRTGYYTKVTSDDDLTNGEYLIVYEDGKWAFDGSIETLNVTGNGFEVTIDNGKIIATAEIDAKSFTITNGTIKSASGKFIGKEADSNGMDEGTTAYTNTLSIVSNNFEVVGSGGAYLRYNSSSNVFRYYKSSTYTNQKAIQLYKKATYTRTVSGNYGTICLPDSGILTNGALYEVAYYDNASQKIFFDEVLNGKMKAGMPYIFLPNEGVTELKVVYTDATNAPVNDDLEETKGLVGSYSKITVPSNEGNYILKNNQYYFVNSSNVYCDANRAYIKMNKVPNYPTAPAPGRRRVSMNVNGEQVATGMDELNASENPVKMMIDGQLFIILGEKMYDATGRLVK